MQDLLYMEYFEALQDSRLVHQLKQYDSASCCKLACQAPTEHAHGHLHHQNRKRALSMTKTFDYLHAARRAYPGQVLLNIMQLCEGAATGYRCS